MKLSLRWIFDHINGDWHTVNVAQLVDQFNRTTATIEHVEPITWNTNNTALVVIKKIHEGFISAHCPEWQTNLELPLRADAVKNTCYLIIKNQDGGYAWTTVAHCGLRSKDALMPALFVAKRFISGAWKQTIETDDYILELDNPSITHRPDLWGTRGIARECAAILGLKLKPDHKFLENIQTIVSDTHSYQSTTPEEFSITNDAPNACSRYAGLHITGLKTSASILPQALRLCRVDQRPINLLVDCANYTMLDWGQPLHTFDADKLGSHEIVIRTAHADEPMALLDGTAIKLTQRDLIITNGKKPIALAGIMGSADSAVDQQTTNVFVESAHFNGADIRSSSTTHHLRTDASARFEKGLDPNGLEDALKRMLKLLAQAKVKYTSTPLIALGTLVQPPVVTVTHDTIEARLGKKIEPKQVITALRSIGFTVTKKKTTYTVEVPSFRGQQSVTIQEDIIEEVGRLIGWDTIIPELPLWRMIPHNNSTATRLRAIKQHLAYALGMHEVRNYPFFDERFLQELGWTPEHTIRAQNPLSLNMTQLVSSLVPHLLMNIQQNTHKQEVLNFFECNRVWTLANQKTPHEQQSCTGIWWHTKKAGDFYWGKQQLSSLFGLLDLPVTWHKTTHTPAWYDSTHVAQLKLGDIILGYAGTSASAFTHDKIPGSGFIFELDVSALVSTQPAEKKFMPLAKYPYVYLDVSMLISLEQTVADIETLIRTADTKIYDVELVDMFFKDEWQDKRSLTFRYYMRDQERTLAKEDIDAISAKVLHTLTTTMGAQIR